MKRCDLTKSLGVFLAIMITLFCGLIPNLWASDDAAECYCCTNQSLKGCYGFSESGTMLINSVSVTMTSVGFLHSDGNGNLTGHETVNLGGDSFTGEIEGTYEVNPDCTGTMTVCSYTKDSDFPSLEIEISFVITGYGQEEVRTLTTDMGYCQTTISSDDDSSESSPWSIKPSGIVGTASKQFYKDDD